MNVKTSVYSLPEYKVPQEAPVKLNQNESPFDLPEKLKKKVLTALEEVAWNRYPPGDLGRLLQQVSGYAGFPFEGILAGCGSNEMIQILIQALCSSGDRVAVVTPGFSVYSRIASVLELEVNEIPLREDFGFDVENIAVRASSDRVVFLASPNNPTGKTLSGEAVEFLAERLSGMLVIDEAYFEFSGQTAQSLISRFERLLILRTFSKAWGLAGLRLGYMMGRPDLIRQLRKAQLPFSLGIFPLLAGEILSSEPELAREAAQTIVSERERVFQVLLKLPGIDPVPSAANFILFRTNKLKGNRIFQGLWEKGILVRCFASPELTDCLRVTVGKPQENDAFITALSSLLKEGIR
jgi:histidinol-phosphate aminotransferase